MSKFTIDELEGAFFVCDNLSLLRALPDECIDLVCIDPPFGRHKTFKGELTPTLSEGELKMEVALLASWGVHDDYTAEQVGLRLPDSDGYYASFPDSVKNRLVKSDGRSPVLPAEADDLVGATARITHDTAMAAHIHFMARRLYEIRRVLKSTGGIYLHCDPTVNAYLRVLMDIVFGFDNFRNEISWSYRTGGVSKKQWPRKHDSILFYSKSKEYEHQPLKERIYYDKPFFTVEGDDEGRYYSDVFVRDVWDDIKPLVNTSGQRCGYPTQKPQELATRMIHASTKRGSLVMDCFAGSGYVPVAAEGSGRRWVACDINPRAWTLTHRQLRNRAPMREWIPKVVGPTEVEERLRGRQDA